jgi:4-azaleucine resistance transporter AzlC
MTSGSVTADAPAIDPDVLRSSRRQLVMDGLGIVITAVGFGLVYGLSAADAGFSLVEAIAMSVIVFAGAAQFAAVGYIVAGLGWPAIVLLTAFLNARHILYSAALAPWLARTPRSTRAVVAHLLTDEAFALSIAHFRRIGATDLRGYWIAGFLITFIPWNLATIAGVVLADAIDETATEAFAIDIVFPAAMAGLALGLVTGRRDVVAATAGAAIAVVASLAWDPAGGIIVGALAGPALAMLVPKGPRASEAEIGAAEAGAGRDPLGGVAP